VLPFLWSAQGTYLTQCAANYATKKGKDLKSEMGLFNGIFFAIFQMAQIIGNLIAGFVLDSQAANSIKTLAYVFIGTGCFGMLSFLFLVPQPEGTEIPPKLSFTQNVFRAIILIKERKMIFLVPLFFYSGIEQGFIFGSFTKDIIGRVMGTEKIGFVMTVFGVFDVLGSFTLGKLADSYNTYFVAVFGFILHTIFFGVFFGLIEIEGFGWFESRTWLIYLGAAIAGLGDAAWNTFPGTITSQVFTDNAEAAFAVCKFSQSLGTFLTFATGGYLTIQVKLTMFFGFMCIALISMIYMQVFQVGKPKHKSIQIQDESNPLSWKRSEV